MRRSETPHARHLRWALQRLARFRRQLYAWLLHDLPGFARFVYECIVPPPGKSRARRRLTPGFDALEDRTLPAAALPFPIIAVGSGEDVPGHARVYDGETGELQHEVAPFGPDYTGSIRTAVGQLTGNHLPDFIVVGGAGEPWVFVYDGETGELTTQFLAHGPNYQSGLFVATGDLDDDGRNEIVTGTGGDHRGTIRVFSAEGTLLGRFKPFGRDYRGPVRVAVGDTDGDGADEIVAAKGAGRPVVAVFDGTTFAEQARFLAYAETMRDGVFVTVGDLDGDCTVEIITGPGGGAPLVKAFTSTGVEFGSFLASDDEEVDGGVRVGTAQINPDDAISDIITALGSGPPTVRVFDGSTFVEFPGDIGEFEAFPPWYSTGLYLSGGNDPATVTLEFSSVTVNEADGSVTIGIQISGAANPTATIHYATANGKAVAGSDYTSTSGSFQTNGDETQYITIPILDDTVAEFPESFTFSITKVSGGANVGSPSTATITIIDDDAADVPVTLGGAADKVASPAQGGSAMSGTGVRWLDGVFQFSVTDLESLGFGTPWGHTRSWSNGNGYASGLPNGNGWVVADLPRLVQPNSTTIVQVSNGATARYFDLVTGNWVARHYEQVELTADTENAELVLTDVAGNVFRFYDFSAGNPAARRGLLKSFADANGNTLSVTSWDSDKPAELQRSNTTGGTTVTESLLYAYISSGTNANLLESVTLRRKVDSGDWVTVRKSEYTYYDGSSETGNGLAGDLRTAVIKDASNNTLDTHYYRYYTSDSGTGYANGLKFVFSPQSFARLAAAYADPFAATDSQVDDFADRFLEYDSSRRVTKQVVQGEGCSACTGGLGTYTYSYTTSSNSLGYNSWRTKVVMTLPDSNENIVYTNGYGEVMLSIFHEVASGDKWITFKQYDSVGRVTLAASPTAVTGYDDTTADLLNSKSGNYQYLSDSAGLVTIYSYYSSTTATESTAGGAAGYLHEVEIQKGETGTAVPQQALAYYKRTADGADVFPVATQTVYRNTDGTGGQTTSYAYTWYSGTTQIESMTVTYPTVTTAQNGPNSADTETVFFDTYGRAVWTKDGDGFLTFTSYDQSTGSITKFISDVDSSQSSTFTGLPSGWSTPSGGGLHLTQTMEVDSLGRTTKFTDPNANITYTVFLDANYEVRVYAGWDDTNDEPTGPTQVIREDRPGSYYETLTMTATPSVTNDRPTGAESISGVQTLARQYTNSAGQVTQTDAYFNLSGLTYSTSTSLGTLNTHFYREQYGYDARGWLNRQVSPTGTITRYVRDGLGRLLSVWVGTNDTPGSGSWSPTNNTSPANMVKVREYVFDNGDVGDGNVTQKTEYPGGGAADRVSQFHYDWRNRLVVTKSGVQGSESTDLNRPISYVEYDNLSQAIAVEQYDGDNVTISDGNSDGVPDKPSSSLRRARSTADFDERGRFYRVSTYSVNQSDGSLSSNALTTNLWYDRRGFQVKTAGPGGVVEKAKFDGAGRLIRSYTTDGGGDSGWSDALTVSGDAVLNQAEIEYDDNGNAILVTTRQRFHDETDTGELGTPTTGVNARVSYSAAWYDAINRTTATADVGTNGGSAYTRPSSVPSRSDTVLVTSHTYNDAGWLQDTTDPRGIVFRREYDALARTTKTIEAYTDGTPTSNSNKTTEFTYDGSGNMLTLKAVLPSSGEQTTQWVYGVTTAGGSAINSNDLLAEVRHPDPSTGAASSSEKDLYTWNAVGNVKTLTDRNGNVHTFTFDVVGRFTTDAVTTLGSGVDGTIRRMEVAYDTAGREYLFTTYDAASGGNVVNQVQRAFNGLGQLTTEYQEHGGAVNTGTSPKVQYAWSEMASGANHSRLTSMTYPNGKVLNYNYTTGLDNNISRLSSLSDSSATLESYDYLGAWTVVRRAHPEPGVDLTYIKQSGESNGDGGDQYTGLDRFGGVVDQRWIKTSPKTSVSPQSN